MDLLDPFDAILFDLNGTLAEEFDRFGPEQDFHATYRRLGGTRLDPAALNDAVRESWSRCLDRYESGPADPFPEFRDFLPDLDPASANLVLETVAVHETGSIPAARVRWLRLLAATHRLGIVSDHWAPPARVRESLRTSGVAAIMQTIVLSCEERAVKPSGRLFRKALAEIGAAPERVLFVGDNYERDVRGAAACGMTTAWISASDNPPGREQPSIIVESVEGLTATRRR